MPCMKCTSAAVYSAPVGMLGIAMPGMWWCSAAAGATGTAAAGALGTGAAVGGASAGFAVTQPTASGMRRNAAPAPRAVSFFTFQRLLARDNQVGRPIRYRPDEMYASESESVD